MMYRIVRQLMNDERVIRAVVFVFLKTIYALLLDGRLENYAQKCKDVSFRCISCKRSSGKVINFLRCYWKAGSILSDFQRGNKKVDREAERLMRLEHVL